jgi:hypothetical protein
MKDRTCQVNKAIFNRCQLLFLCFLLPLSTACLSDEAVAKIEAATKAQPQPFDDIGEPKDGRQKEKPKIEDLGKARYRIGTIIIDKARRLITIPGVMLPYEEGKMIEFMATMKQGYKSYESVFSLEANAFEFNLACILIGLDPEKAVSSKFHFDPQPVQGDPVSIKVSWEKNGKSVEYDVIELLKTGETKPDKPSVWSYTGSMFVEGDRYLAQMDGVLIGLIHDPASIIEHKKGLAVGNWGSIAIDPGIAPHGGQEIIISIQGLDI